MDLESSKYSVYLHVTDILILLELIHDFYVSAIDLHPGVATEFSSLINFNKDFLRPRGFHSFRCYFLTSLNSVSIFFVKKIIVHNEQLSLAVRASVVYLQNLLLFDFIYIRKY